MSQFKYAWVWGSSVRHQPQKVLFDLFKCKVCADMHKSYNLNRLNAFLFLYKSLQFSIIILIGCVVWQRPFIAR